MVETGGGDVSEPDGEQAQDHGQADIRSRPRPLAVLHQGESLMAEAGERRVSAAEADHDELPVLGGDENRPSGAVSVPKNPMTNDPTTFTTSVPQGKVAPTALATMPEHQ